MKSSVVIAGGGNRCIRILQSEKVLLVLKMLLETIHPLVAQHRRRRLEHVLTQLSTLGVTSLCIHALGATTIKRRNAMRTSTPNCSG